MVIGYWHKAQGFFMLDYEVGVPFLPGITATNEIIAKATMMVVLRRRSKHLCPTICKPHSVFVSCILTFPPSSLPSSSICCLSIPGMPRLLSLALSLSLHSSVVEEVYPLICNFRLLHILQNSPSIISRGTCIANMLRRVS